jgi:hypothetical protein
MSFDEIASRYQALGKFLGCQQPGAAVASFGGGLDGFLERCFASGATVLKPSEWVAG